MSETVPDAAPAVELARVLPGEPEPIFDACTDPSRVREWVFPEPGRSARMVRFDRFSGGRFDLSLRNGAGSRRVASGVVEHLHRPGALRLHWEDPRGLDPVRIVLRLEAEEGDGGAGTRLDLRLESTTGAPLSDAMSSFWEAALDRLESFLARSG